MIDYSVFIILKFIFTLANHYGIEAFIVNKVSKIPHLFTFFNAFVTLKRISPLNRFIKIKFIIYFLIKSHKGKK